MDLLWRNDIDPEKVVMGLGFYGRSKESIYLFEEMGSADGLPAGFTLSDSSCTTPGCPFLTGGRFDQASVTQFDQVSANFGINLRRKSRAVYE